MYDSLIVIRMDKNEPKANVATKGITTFSGTGVGTIPVVGHDPRVLRIVQRAVGVTSVADGPRRGRCRHHCHFSPCHDYGNQLGIHDIRTHVRCQLQIG